MVKRGYEDSLLFTNARLSSAFLPSFSLSENQKKQANSIGNLSPALFLFELLKMSKLTRGPLVLYQLPKY